MSAAGPLHRFPPLKRDYRGYIFDCDGTLADSMPLHFKAWRMAFKAHGAPLDFTWDLFLRLAGKTIELTSEELNVEFGMTLDRDEVARVQRAAYDALIPEVAPVVPVFELLRGIAGRAPVAV